MAHSFCTVHPEFPAKYAQPACTGRRGWGRTILFVKPDLCRHRLATAPGSRCGHGLAGLFADYRRGVALGTAGNGRVLEIERPCRRGGPSGHTRGRIGVAAGNHCTEGYKWFDTRHTQGEL